MTPDDLATVMDHTWPAARQVQLGPCTLRIGAGGGQRVSATSVAGNWQDADLDAAEAAMDGAGQPRLWVVRQGQIALDAALAARGYRINDPVVAYAAPVAQIAAEVSPMAAFLHWPPLAIACDIWAEGGIGPARVAVMERVTGPKTAILSRADDTPSGAAFVAICGKTAMLHALEVRPDMRRHGSGAALLHAAANWARDQGAPVFSLVVTERNDAARKLYEKVGLQQVGGYHYRVR